MTIQWGNVQGLLNVHVFKCHNWWHKHSTLQYSATHHAPKTSRIWERGWGFASCPIGAQEERETSSSRLYDLRWISYITDMVNTVFISKDIYIYIDLYRKRQNRVTSSPWPLAHYQFLPPSLLWFALFVLFSSYRLSFIIIIFTVIGIAVLYVACFFQSWDDGMDNISLMSVVRDSAAMSVTKNSLYTVVPPKQNPIHSTKWDGIYSASRS